MKKIKDKIKVDAEKANLINEKLLDNQDIIEDKLILINNQIKIYDKNMDNLNIEIAKCNALIYEDKELIKILKNPEDKLKNIYYALIDKYILKNKWVMNITKIFILVILITYLCHYVLFSTYSFLGLCLLYLERCIKLFINYHKEKKSIKNIIEANTLEDIINDLKVNQEKKKELEEIHSIQYHKRYNMAKWKEKLNDLLLNISNNYHILNNLLNFNFEEIDINEQEKINKLVRK